MDAMLVEKNKHLSEKEDYIIHLQMAIGGEKAVKTAEQITPENKARETPFYFITPTANHKLPCDEYISSKTLS